MNTMKATGHVRRIDNLGRIVIPSDLRKEYRMAEGDAIEIFTTEHGLMIKKYQVSCMFCDEVIDVIKYENATLCKSCIVSIAKNANLL